MVLNLRDRAQNIGLVNVVMSTIAMSLSSYMCSTYIVLYMCNNGLDIPRRTAEKPGEGYFGVIPSPHRPYLCKNIANI